VPIEYEESSPAQDAARQRRLRLFALLDQAATYYARTLWDSHAGGMARDYLKGRGLSEDTCREFRLGLALGGDRLARGALEKGFTREELRAAGLTRQRGDDYFQRRLLFPLADARGQVRGFQARKLRDDDALQAKYVNSPESALFKKGDLLYGLDGSRQQIAKQDRAVIVEGNTDVIALRQAGFEPVVASMGTALTEAQLRELNRLTKRLFLCFDSDAAGQEATLRGMELAVKQGFDVQVVPLPKGTDPADDPQAFQRELARPVGYLVHRVRLLHQKAPDQQSAYAEIRAFLNAHTDSPEHQEARRLATDLLDLPPETQVALAPASGRRRGVAITPRLLEAGQRLERSALAGVAVNDKLQRFLEGLTPEHFDSELHRRVRAHLLGEKTDDADVLTLVDELHALAGLEEIDEHTTMQLLLKLRERRLQEELRNAPVEQRKTLSGTISALRDEMEKLATMPAANPR
jgi:DNA primase catalytic core